MFERIGSAAVLLSALGLFGCNNLTGVEGVGVDGDEVVAGDPVNEANYAPAPQGITCAYPVGGMVGIEQGMTLPSTHTWRGYKAGETEARDIPAAEFFDCDGSRHLDAVIFDTSQYG
jgi:hypothetical protein